MTSADGFSDSLVKGIERGFGVDDTAEAVVYANDDASVKAVVNAISRLNHRAPAGESMVEG